MDPEVRCARHQFRVRTIGSHALSPPLQKRKIYDRYGEDGLKQAANGGGGNPFHDPRDIFSQFFGGRGEWARVVPPLPSAC